ncbi:MAG TPA: sigma-70 family RNA polymerase sigma factor [Actinomycetota bacterium]|nr:sigma-70 family RNA polymerase sigma factor [Actinomycetota bacterium]
MSPEKTSAPPRIDGRRRSDLDLVLAFQGGDPSAYADIYRRYRPLAERICLRFLANAFDAEEAAQETMVRVLQNLKSFNGRYALRPWVARIARNVCLDVLRAKARRSANGEELNGDLPDQPNGNGHAEGDPSEVVERLAERKDVHDQLARLPEQHRVALVLRELEGFSHREIAQVIGTSPARVKALLHRARRGFRRAWDANGGVKRKLGLLLPPFLIPVNALRRLLGRVQDIDPSGVVAAPATQHVAASGAERISAAVAAVVVAGTVGVAATRGSEPEPARQKAPEVVIAAPASVGQEDEAPQGKTARQKDRKPVAARDQHKPAAASNGTAEPSTTDDEALEVSASTTTTAPEEEQVKDAPRPTAQSTPAAPAGFAFSFRAGATATDYCDCGWSTALAEDTVTASESRLTSFSQQIRGGAIRDASGRPAWAVEVRQSGTEKTHDLAFSVVSGGGIHQYTARGAMTSRTATRWGGWVLVFSGTYESRGGPGDSPTGLPDRGSYTATLAFSYTEARLVEASFSLH